VNAEARPEWNSPGGSFYFIARGFKPGEKIGIYFCMPDWSVYDKPFLSTADDQGVSKVVTFKTNRSLKLPLGTWSIMFEGVETHNKAIAYFILTDRYISSHPHPEH
jgi:hypothetical protein